MSRMRSVPIEDVAIVLCALAAALASLSAHADLPIFVLLGITVVATSVRMVWGAPGRREAILLPWALGAAILIAYGLRGPHLFLDDALRDYGAAQSVIGEGRWHPAFPPFAVDRGQYGLTGATVVPAMIALTLGTGTTEYVFKLLYPLLFSMTPVAIFLIAERLPRGSAAAAWAALFLIAQPLFGLLSMVGRVAIGGWLLSVFLMMVLKPSNQGSRANLAGPIVILCGLIPAYYNAALVVVVILWALVFAAWLIVRSPARRALVVFALLASGLAGFYYFSGVTTAELPGALRAFVLRAVHAPQHIEPSSVWPPAFVGGPQTGPLGPRTRGEGPIPRSWGPAIWYALGLDPVEGMRSPLELVELLMRYLAAAVVLIGLVHIVRSSLSKELRWLLAASIGTAGAIGFGVVFVPVVSTLVEMSTINLLCSIPLAIGFASGVVALGLRWGTPGRVLGAAVVTALMLFSTGLLYRINPQRYYGRVWTSEEMILANASVAHDKFLVWDTDVAAARWLAQYAVRLVPLQGDYMVRYLYLFNPPESWPAFPRYEQLSVDEWGIGYVLLRTANTSRWRLWPGWAWRDPTSLSIPASFAGLDVLYSNGSAMILSGRQLPAPLIGR